MTTALILGISGQDDAYLAQLLLEAIRFNGKATKLYNAGSSECFGDLPAGPADETTPFRPRSPYAVAKAAAF
jgi:GDPmannose 4,6-dehydratase